jgi:8-amino-7-oxononanoate synthase
LNHKQPQYSFIKYALEKRALEHRLRTLISLEPSLDKSVINIEGRKYLNFSSNDYLGLSTHPAVVQRSKDYLEKFGASSSSSRLITGTLSIHEQLEKKLSDTFGYESALIFNSGFQANLSILSALADRNSVIFIDKKCHNSLIQGTILSRATIKRYHHNNYEHLEELISAAQTSSYNRKIIVSETVFSMDGDRCDMDALIHIANKYNALFYSDDAHALGVLGTQGLGLNYGKKAVDIGIGTFGKSCGGFGAFVGCSKQMKEYLINFASGFIYSTALPPSVIGALDAAIELIPSMENERRHLFNLLDYIITDLKHTFDIGNSESQILPIIIGDESKVIKFSNYLQDNGLWVSSIRPPTVEEGASRIRITLSARHTKEHVQQLVKVMKSWNNG